MSTPFLGEIRMTGFNFAPRGWMLCNGQTLPIAQYQALFALLGTTYGGNGVSTFQLPNLQGRVPIHQGSGQSGTPYIIGENSGAENVTILYNNMPIHTHSVNAVTSGGNSASPAGTLPAVESTGTSLNYASTAGNTTMNPAMIGTAGGNVPISVIQPFLVVNFIIAFEGIFPSRN
jgi:microcystin-dependent protein